MARLKNWLVVAAVVCVGVWVSACSTTSWFTQDDDLKPAGASTDASQGAPSSSTTSGGGADGSVNSPSAASPEEPSYMKESQGDFPLISTVARDDSRFLTPTYFQPKRPLRIGFLMPFSSKDPQIAQLATSFYKASQLALMAQRNPDVLLIPEDTGDDPSKAAQVGQDVIDKGADVIIGPLTGPAVTEVAPIARKYAVPIIAFSNDDSVAANGVYLFSFLPEMDVYTIATYALDHGLKRFAVLAPDTDYGRRTSEYFLRFVTQKGGEITSVFRYPVDAKARTGSVNMNLLINAVSQLAQSAKDKPFDAIFLPDGGTSLKTVAPMLPYFHIDTRSVRVLGTSLFDDPTLTKVRGLEGAWFPAVRPDAYQEFFIDYKASYGSSPTKMATLAYDATNLAISLARYHEKDGAIPLYLIARPKGFLGATGMFRFTPGGFTERVMIVEQITATGIKILQAASAQFPDMTTAPSFNGQPAVGGHWSSGLQPGEPGAPFNG